MMVSANCPDPVDIIQWLRLDERLTTSGQPREDQLPALHGVGVSHVINLALHSHEQALADEGASLAALSIGYTHIPVDFSHPTDADYSQFRSVMQRLDGEVVYVHCIANLRVSAFLYRYRRDEGGMPEREARAAMESLWRPGGVWACFIGDVTGAERPHLYAGRDYQPS